jgi:hypothetical protein
MGNWLKIGMGGKWYVRVLKVCIAFVGASLLVVILFWIFAFVGGFLARAFGH